MANLILVNNHKKKRLQKTKLIQVISLIQIASLVGAFFTKGLTLIIMFICMIVSSNLSKKQTEHLRKDTRTRETRDALSDLSDNYTVLTDIELKDNKHTLHLDHVVVGDNGVFLIKVKGWTTNEVHGGVEDREWLLTDLKGTRKEMNPIKQVKTQTHFFSKVLKDNGINTWIQGIVYFTNRNSYYDVDVETLNATSDVPVFLTIFSGEVHLYDYITNYKPKKKLSKNVQKEIVEFLQKNGK